jgi:hypothetical protein
VPEALHDVVVDHPDRLHEGIDDGRADEREAAFVTAAAIWTLFRTISESEGGTPAIRADVRGEKAPETSPAPRTRPVSS